MAHLYQLNARRLELPRYKPQQRIADQAFIPSGRRQSRLSEHLLAEAQRTGPGTAYFQPRRKRSNNSRYTA